MGFLPNAPEIIFFHLEAIAPAENPANMTEWMAPILVQASMDATASGEIGM